MPQIRSVVGPGARRAGSRRWIARGSFAKEADKEHERQVRELRDRMGSLQKDRDQIRQELVEARSDLKTATAMREHLEDRLRRLPETPSRKTPATARRKLGRQQAKTARPRNSDY
jgi:uncharacterized coiled-coil DUF342 family protein